MGLSEVCPDLAIWIYPQYRHRGYGAQSFMLALKYIFDNYPYPEISAGCYEDNVNSLKMHISLCALSNTPDSSEYINRSILSP